MAECANQHAAPYDEIAHDEDAKITLKIASYDERIRKKVRNPEQPLQRKEKGNIEHDSHVVKIDYPSTTQLAPPFARRGPRFQG
jgi:hypothetical protein